MDELIYNNIARHLSGEATEAEQKVLQDWLAADPENRAVYDDLKVFWEKADQVVAAPAFDRNKAWEKIAPKIQSETKPARNITFTPWMRYGIAAAAVLLIGLFVINNFAGNKMVTIAAADANMEITLPDNSHIILRKGSTLHYPETFAGSERKVQLEGEAFFDVARNEQKPFIIDAQAATVQVLGTSFSVKCTEAQATVMVKTGKVQMSDSKTSASVVLTPGEKGSLKGGRLTEEAISTSNILYWQTGSLTFTETALSEIIKELAQLKDTTIVIDAHMPEEQKHQLINITFGDQSLDEMMTELCLVAQCQWSRQNNTYVISGR